MNKGFSPFSPFKGKKLFMEVKDLVVFMCLPPLGFYSSFWGNVSRPGLNQSGRDHGQRCHNWELRFGNWRATIGNA